MSYNFEVVIESFKSGKFVLIADDSSRENECDLVISAEFATADKINGMIKQARGVMCLSLSHSRCKELNLHSVGYSSSLDRPSFTNSIDLRSGISTGVSSKDRAATIKAVLDPYLSSDDLISPGHIFPISEHRGGVLARQGHTEASVALARLANLYPAAVLSEVLDDNGDCITSDDAEKFAESIGITVCKISDIIKHAYFAKKKSLIEAKSVTELSNGLFLTKFVDTYNGDIYLVVSYMNRSDEYGINTPIYFKNIIDINNFLTEDMTSLIKAIEAEKGVIIMKSGFSDEDRNVDGFYTDIHKNLEVNNRSFLTIVEIIKTLNLRGPVLKGISYSSFGTLEYYGCC